LWADVGVRRRQGRRRILSGRTLRTNFLLNIDYGDRTPLHPRLPRLGFDEVARWE